MPDLNDKVCVVTGAASGIGRAAAVKLAASGAKAVVAADIDEAGARETVKRIEAAGGTASAKRTDVEEPDQIYELMQYAADQYGSLDALVNNVGVHEMYWADQTTVDKLPLEVFEKIYRINLRSVFIATQAAAPHLRGSTNDPTIINAASTGSFTGYPGAGAYGSTKAAILQFTRVAAVDLAPHIRVKRVRPRNGRHRNDRPDARRHLRGRPRRPGENHDRDPPYPADGHARGRGEPDRLPSLAGSQLDHRRHLHHRRRLPRVARQPLTAPAEGEGQ